MKSLIFLTVAISQITCAMANPAMTHFTMRVVDSETGLPVTNAVAKTSFLLKYDPFAAHSDEVERQEVAVNSKGLAVLEGKTLRQTGGGATIYAEGYYTDGGGFGFERKNPVFNRWEPWNPMIEVRMRPKKNPVAMIHKYLENKKIPVFDQPVGLDLKVGDWVIPHGKGKTSDFIFSATLVTQPKEGIRYSLSFANPVDGLLEYVPPKDLRSEYIFPYEAPTNGYDAALSRYRLLKYPVLPDYPANNLKENINYIFRVRTKVDEDGNIVSANYGRIRGEIRSTMKGGFYFSYWFNPEPNNRSLESLEKPY